MKITKTLYVTNRQEWRKWLKQHYNKEPEIWLIYYRKDSGKPRIAYNDSVEEALCFGWIDSTVKNIDHERFAQRFTPRNPKSPLSETNKERVRRLIKKGKMRRAGILAIVNFFNSSPNTFTISADILKKLKTDKKIWNNFQEFPESYKRIRISWIDGVRKRPTEFKKRLSYFIKMTKANKKFGMVQ